MAIPEEMVKKMAARRLAKEFRSRIGTNLAIRLPDDIIDQLGDDQVEDFFAYCKQFGLVRRDDCFWERAI
jgi:hypothetical protein